MRKQVKKVLVTGIGGNVGQGIIRNIRKSFPDLHVTGTNIADFSAGNHLCDAFYRVPYADDLAYIRTVQAICEKEKIDLILPSTDYEAYFLSRNRSNLTGAVAVSDAKATEIYLDKYLSFEHHRQHAIPFAASCLPSVYQGQFKDYIAKPRNGRGSRGLFINPPDWSVFSDEKYVIQELHTGKEITTAFYVDRQSNLHGFITLLRFLENGATAQCKVVFEYDTLIRPILEAMIRCNNFQGSINLQSIVTDDGAIQPFEVNCRISGTNSIRSNFGFEDVKYTIQEFLFNQAPSRPEVAAGVAVRILMDVIYPDQVDFDSCKDKGTPFQLF